MAWSKAVGIGVIPFLPGDIAKIIAATLVITSLRQLMGATHATAPDGLATDLLRSGK
jgi:biotin transporter BioY